MKFRSLVLGIAAAIGSSSVLAMTPPAPVWQNVDVGDGSQISVQLKGSRALSWYVDKEGNTLIHKDGQWFYGHFVEKGSDLHLESTGVLASQIHSVPTESQIKPDLSKVKFHEALTSDVGPRARVFKQQAIQHGGKRQLSSPKAPFEQPLLVVEISFKNEVMVNDFSDLLFNKNGKSVYDYFLKNSFGQYHVVPAKETQGTANDGVIRLSLDQEHPNCHRSDVCTFKTNAVFTEAYKEIDTYLDLSQYDLNENGFIDPTELSVMFIFAGGDKSAGTLGNTIWPHKSSHTHQTLDGKKIAEYCLFADFQQTHQSTLGVIAHELGHLMLGLPDLYSYHDRVDVGSWGLMGAGSWSKLPSDNYSGETPVNMLAWSKHASGFITPQTLTTSQDVTLQTGEAGLLYLDPYLKEYGTRLYIENRPMIDYDAALVGSGALVTSVNVDNPFNAPAPMQVQIMKADGSNTPAPFSFSTAGDPFPGLSGQTQLTDTTKPSLSAMAGFETGVQLSNISSDAESASFSLKMVEQPNKFGWLTQLGRAMAIHEKGINTTAFEVELSESATLDGMHFYTQHHGESAVNYTLTRYEPVEANFASLVLDETQGKEVLSGSVSARMPSKGALSGGRIIFDIPTSLNAGKHLFVLSTSGGDLEYSYNYGGIARIDSLEKKKVWLGNDQDLTSEEGLTRLSNFVTVPLALLLEKNIDDIAFANHDEFTIQRNESLQLPLRTNDFIQPGYDFSLEIIQKPKFGTFDGAKYTPDAEFKGRDSFTYRWASSSLEATSNIATVSLNVVGENRPPVAALTFDKELALSGRSMRLNASSSSDIDGDRIHFSWKQLKGAPVEMLSLTNSIVQVTFPATSKTNDPFEFEVKVTDEYGLSATQNAVITIVNAPPIAVEDEVIVRVDDTFTIDVLANDSDPDGEQLTLVSISNVPMGTAEVVDGKIEYSAPSYIRRDVTFSILYQIQDSKGDISDGVLKVMLSKTAVSAVIITQSDEPTEPAEPTTTTTPASSGGSSGGGSMPIWFTAFVFAAMLLRRRRN